MDNIKLIMENDKYIEGEIGGKAVEIKFSDIKPYWDYATADDCDFSSVLYNENEIIGLMTTAQGQGGIVFVWDIAKSAITHISEASFAVGFYLFKGMIYTVEYITSWGREPHFSASKVEMGTIDANNQLGKIINLDIEFSTEEYDNEELVEFSENGNELYAEINGKKYLVDKA